jgi:superfamily II RNA helicase
MYKCVCLHCVIRINTDTITHSQVHSINNSEHDGYIWERLLQINTSPFLALSATVGNPTEFYDWLARVQACHNRKVSLIVHPTRWSDLEKYMFLPLTVDAEERSKITDLRTHRCVLSACVCVCEVGLCVVCMWWV